MDVWSRPGRVDIAVSNQNLSKYQQYGRLKERDIRRALVMRPSTRHWRLMFKVKTLSVIWRWKSTIYNGL